MHYFVSLFLAVSTSAVNCLERLVSEMACYVSSGMSTYLHTHLPIHWIYLKTVVFICPWHASQYCAEILSSGHGLS